MDVIADGPHERTEEREQTSQMYVCLREDESRSRCRGTRNKTHWWNVLTGQFDTTGFANICLKA